MRLPGASPGAVRAAALFEVLYEDVVGTRAALVKAYGDLAVVTKPVRYGDGLEWASVYLLSVAGPDSAVRAVASALCEHRSLLLRFPSRRVNAYPASGGWRLFVGNAGQAAHAVCVHESVFSWCNGSRVVVSWDGSAEEALWSLLASESPVPVRREWARWLLSEAERREEVGGLVVFGRARVAALRVGENFLKELGQVVSRGVRCGRLWFDGASASPSPHLAGLRSLDEYLKMFGPALGRQVVENFRPLYDPVREEPDPRFFRLLREPFRAQADAGEGLVRLYREQRSALLVGECGVGKTLVGAAVPWVLYGGRPCRVLAMVPNHLVRKWKREVEETVPGARAVVLSDWRDAYALRDLPRKPACPEYYILARDTAKLGFYWKPAAVWREGKKKKRRGWYCPDCGRLLVDRDGVPFPREEFGARRKRNLKCPHCRTSLWQADGSRVRKVAPADVIKKYVKRRKLFQFLIADEVHELKGDTAQGVAFGVLAGCAERVLVLTGTLLNGYASSLHYILHRLDPDALLAEGIRYGEVQKWVERYGVLEKVVKESPDAADYNWSSRGRKPRVSVRERPGVSPLLFLRHLLGSTVFLDLADLGCFLPECREEVRLVGMDPELERAYHSFAEKLRDEVVGCLRGGSRRLLGTYLQNLLSYPDRPWDNPPVVDPKDGREVAVPPELPRVVRPKEEALLDLVREELSRGRRVFVYVSYTKRRDVTARLRELLESEGIRAAVLTSDVPPAEREEWLERRCLEGAQVVVAQARLVETGLDLTGVKNFPTLVFYQTGYNLFTLRQASRRSWRIGQEHPVRVVYLAYRGTLQETALQLMGSKLEAALLLEGKFSSEGLLALASGEDLTAELARALVEGLDGVDSAEAIWRRVGGVPVAERERAVELVALSDFFRKRRRKGSGPLPVQLGFAFLLSPGLAAGKSA